MAFSDCKQSTGRLSGSSNTSIVTYSKESAMIFIALSALEHVLFGKPLHRLR
jgi:hypothetical protein